MRPRLTEVEGAHIVEPHDVVGVLMREHDGVQPGDGGAQGLRAKIGGDVDQHMVLAVREQNRRAQALIARIGRGANVAMAADGGHARTSAGAEHGDLETARHSGGLLLGFVDRLHVAEPQ